MQQNEQMSGSIPTKRGVLVAPGAAKLGFIISGFMGFTRAQKPTRQDHEREIH